MEVTKWLKPSDMALITWVRCRIKRSRARCNINRPCYLADLTLTKRIVGRRTRAPHLAIARLHRKYSRMHRAMALPRHQQPDHQQIEDVRADAGGEGGRVIAEMIIQQAGDPAAARHADAAA